MCSHRERAYEQFKTELKISEELEDKSIILPLYLQLSIDEISYITNKLKFIV